MKNSQKGFIVPLVVIVVAILVICGIVYMYKSKGGEADKEINLKTNTQATPGVVDVKDAESLKVGDKVAMFTVTSVNIYRDYVDTNKPSGVDITFSGQVEVSGTYSINDWGQYVFVPDDTKKLPTVRLTGQTFPMDVFVISNSQIANQSLPLSTSDKKNSVTIVVKNPKVVISEKDGVSSTAEFVQVIK